jgi:hypothetical protein
MSLNLHSMFLIIINHMVELHCIDYYKAVGLRIPWKYSIIFLWSLNIYRFLCHQNPGTQVFSILRDNGHNLLSSYGESTWVFLVGMEHYSACNTFYWWKPDDCINKAGTIHSFLCVHAFLDGYKFNTMYIDGSRGDDVIEGKIRNKTIGRSDIWVKGQGIHPVFQ